MYTAAISSSVGFSSVKLEPYTLQKPEQHTVWSSSSEAPVQLSTRPLGAKFHMSRSAAM